jgi:hypothetical protein
MVLTRPKVGAAALAAILTLAILSPVTAHKARSGMEYESWCCNGKDCAEIPEQAVKAGPNGWVITLKPGEHPMVTRTQQRVIPYHLARVSEDARYHICLWPTENDQRCFYAPPQGF